MLLFSQVAASLYWCLGLCLLGFLQGFALPVDEQHEVPVSPFLLAFGVSLDGSTSLWCVNSVSGSLAEGTLCHIIQVINCQGYLDASG